MAVVEGSGSILKDMARTHAKLFGICVLFVLCLQDVQGQYSPWTINFSWAMGYLLFEVQILIFRSILLLEIKASGSVLHPSREPLHSTSLWRVKWRQCLVLSRELWSYNWYIDQGEREFFFWRYSIVFILLWPLLKILTHSNLVVIYFLFFCSHWRVLFTKFTMRYALGNSAHDSELWLLGVFEWQSYWCQLRHCKNHPIIWATCIASVVIKWNECSSWFGGHDYGCHAVQGTWVNSTLQILVL